MPSLDFAQLDGETFEDLCEDLFKAMGFDDPPPERSGRGPDAGRDLVVTEHRWNNISGSSRPFRWLVQCKNFARSGRSVRPQHAGHIMDKLSRHRADGYLLVTSTIPSSDLEGDIVAIDEDVRHPFEATYWSKARLTDEIRRQRTVYERYFGFADVVTARPAHWSTRNPFVELFAYDEVLAGYFFGREKDTNKLVEALYRNNVVLLYGESGVGKTSVINAGIVPLLKEEGTAIVRVAVGPGSGPGYLIDRLRQWASTLPGIESRSPASSGATFEALARTLRQDERRLIVVLDQFETLLASGGDCLTQIGADLAELVSAAKRFDSIAVLVSLRSDYLDDLGIRAVEWRVPDLWANAYPLRRLSAAQVSDILAKVPPIVDARFAPEVTDSILCDLRGIHRGEIYPPDLQIVASRVFDQARSRAALDTGELAIVQEDYEAVGASRGVLAAFLDDKLADLGENQELARKILLALVSATGMRLDLPVGTISERTSCGTERVRSVLEYLVEARLVRPAGRPNVFELVHDVLAARILEVTDDEQLKPKAAREAFDLALNAWQTDGVPESGRKLDWYYRYRQWLLLDVDALIFLLISETVTVSQRDPFFKFLTARQQTRNAKRGRWIESADPAICAPALDRVLALGQAERVDESLIRDIAGDICSASDLTVQRDIVEKLQSLESSAEGTLLAEAYEGSAIPNEAAMGYLQNLAVSELPDNVMQSVTRRVLEHYRNTLPSFVRRRQRAEVVDQEWREAFPRHLLEDSSFRGAVFEYLQNASGSRQPENMGVYKLELLQMLHAYDPDRSTAALRAMIPTGRFSIGLRALEAIELLRIYDPDWVIREVVRDAKEKSYLLEQQITALGLVNAPAADDLLVSNVKRYVETFEGGSKRWKGGFPAPRRWNRLLRQTLEVALRRRLVAVVPYLTTIVLRYEPANVKLSCLTALVEMGSEEHNWPTFVKLLNDTSAQVRNLCARELLKMENYHQRLVEEIELSLTDESSKPGRHFLPHGHKDALAAKVSVLRRLRSPAAVRLLKRIARSSGDEEVAELASRAVATLGRRTEGRKRPDCDQDT